MKQNLKNNMILYVMFLGVFCVAPLHAATKTFSNFRHVGSDKVSYEVIIADDNESGVTTGKFKVSYSVLTGSEHTTAKFTGFFADVADRFTANNSPYNAGNLGLSNDAPVSCAQDFNTNSISSNGCNTSLVLGNEAGEYKSHLFDLGLAWKSNDLSSGQIGMFEIADLGLTLADWVGIGLRGQETNGNGGSAKEFQFVSQVPVPAAVWLFGSGLMGLVVGCRKATSKLP